MVISLILLPAYGFQYQYDSLEKIPEYDAVFNLINSQDSTNTTKLDCQSFIHKLDIEDSKLNVTYENFIDFYECEELYIKFARCIKDEKTVCIDSNNIFSDQCSCN